MAAVKATIGFGAFSASARLVPMMQEKNGTISFKTLHSNEGCMVPVKQTKFCPVCSEEITPTNSIRGFEVTKGKFVPVTNEEYDSAQPTRSTEIEITKFIPDLDRGWIDSSYWLAPEEMTEKRYSIMVRALEQTGLIGFGTAAPWGKERPFAVFAHEGLLLFCTLHTSPELNTEKPVPVVPIEDEKTEAAVKMAAEAMLAWSDPLDETDLLVTPDVLMKSLIASKIEGSEFVVPEPKPLIESPPDILEALRQTKAMKTSHKKAAKKAA